MSTELHLFYIHESLIIMIRCPPSCSSEANGVNRGDDRRATATQAALEATKVVEGDVGVAKEELLGDGSPSAMNESGEAEKVLDCLGSVSVVGGVLLQDLSDCILEDM